MTTHKNIPLVGKHHKPIVTDFIYNDSKNNLPILIFCHGYKGFKDWGPWHMMLNKFADNGFFVVAFNFSHNGGTIENPIDFPDLEAFGNDNFSIQQDDLKSVIDEVTDPKFKFSDFVNIENVTLVGHSRGGGQVILKAAHEPKITQLVTLAAINTYETAMPNGDKLEQWKNDGVMYVINGRTQQKMPHYYQLFEDYQKNKEALNIEKAAKKLTIPHLIVHGTNDEAVEFKRGEALHQWSKKSELFSLNTNHVFGGSHPWEKDHMPKDLEVITNKILEFLS